MGSERKGFRALLTIPNALSVARLLGVPVFLWLVLGPRADGWALLVLALSGFSDWLDGQLARAWNQTSRLGELLDPTADRLYIFAVVIGLSLRGIIPFWFAGLLVLRDVVLLLCGPVLRRHGYGALPVHFLGKAATFNLLYAFPLLLLGGGAGIVSAGAKIIGWAFAIWGSALYWWAAVLYVVQVRQLIRSAPRWRSALVSGEAAHDAGHGTAPDVPSSAGSAGEAGAAGRAREAGAADPADAAGAAGAPGGAEVTAPQEKQRTPDRDREGGGRNQ